MSKTKIKAALSALDKAAKAAFKTLNEVADGTYEGSPAEADPVRHAHEISQRLHKELDQIETRATYEGLSEEEIVEKKATELAAIREKQAREAAEKLKALKPESAAPEPVDPETEDDADDLGDDQDGGTNPVDPETGTES